MEFGRIIFRTDIGNENLKMWFRKTTAIIIIVVSLSHFNENPIVIAVLDILLFSYIILFSVAKVLVYKNGFKVKTEFTITNLLSKKEFFYKDINQIIYPVDFEVKTLPPKQAYLNRIDSRRKIYVLFQDGSEQLISTTVPWGYLGIAIQKIKQQKNGIKNTVLD